MRMGVWGQNIILIIVLSILFIFLSLLDRSVLNVILLLRILVHLVRVRVSCVGSVAPLDEAVSQRKLHSGRLWPLSIHVRPVKHPIVMFMSQ